MALRRGLKIRAARAALGAAALCVPAVAEGAAPSQPLLPHPPPAAAAAPAAPPVLTPVPAPASPESTSAAAPVKEPPVSNGSLPELPPATALAAAPRVTEPAAVPEGDWYDSFDVRLFADAYFSWNYNAPKPQVGGNDVVRAFDSANGFSLAWAGLDVSHAAEPIGGALSLRFGPSARRYNSSCVGNCDASYGLENVKQAFASFRPGGGKFSVDFGKFDTIYGVEVADSQDNMNYSRGALYWLGQPLFHTGLRFNAELTQNLTLRALIVNGWNNTIDNNTGKTFGIQAIAHTARNESHDWLSASLGYLGGPEQSDIGGVDCPVGNVFDTSSPSGCSPSATPGPTTGTVDRPSNDTKGWRHFIDFVLTSDPLDALHLVLNADLGVERQRDAVASANFKSHAWLGAMLGARYLLTSAFAVAARGELYRDKDGVTLGSVNGLKISDVTLTTGTLTLDYLSRKNLIVRLDNRLDHSTKEIFPKGIRELNGNLFTTTLGVVVTTN